jgi:hypothetical protein
LGHPATVQAAAPEGLLEVIADSEEEEGRW